MRSSRQAVRLLAVGASLTALAVVSLAGANDCGHSAALPTTDPIGCANCHNNQQAPGRLDLNPFGQDFAAEGRVWNARLASLDSDGDDCANGFELGDSNGDGLLDGYITHQNSNPGVPDCSGSAFNDPVTWGNLKALFKK